jgi:hypothetical protein
MLLKATVERDMPCLTAELVMKTEDLTMPGDHDPLLEGQISLWTLRISNVGNAPASNISLKTSLPWVNILSDHADITSTTVDEREARSTSQCVGPTGTLMTLPMHIGESLQGKDAILPGESMDITIQLRTSGGGKQDFYMLYRYELWDPMSNSRRHRWLKKMYKVPVSNLHMMFQKNCGRNHSLILLCLCTRCILRLH